MPIKIHLFGIDPQVDFCDPTGALYVPGAEDDMQRMADLVLRLKDKLHDIHITLDSHRKVDISHPIWFVDIDNGDHPEPLTMMSLTGNPLKGLCKLMDGTKVDLPGDTISGFNPIKGTTRIYTTRVRGYRYDTMKYLAALLAGKRYPHTIWPPHCLTGHKGHNVQPVLWDACAEWEDRFAQVAYYTKSSNPWTEHFSAIKAEVPRADDPTTDVNMTLINPLIEADVVLTGGEAENFCLANSLYDLVANFPDPAHARKIKILSDCTSPISGTPGLDKMTDDFRAFCAKHGIERVTSTDFLKAS